MKKDVESLDMVEEVSSTTERYLKVNIELSKDKFENVENTAEINNISSSSIFLACLYILLYKFSYNSNIIIDSSISFIDFAKSMNADILTSNEAFTLFDVMLSCKKSSIIDTPENCNLHFIIDDENDTLSLEFNKDIFTLAYAKSILAHFLFIIKQAFKNSNIKISDFNIITPEECTLLEKFNDEFSRYAR